MYQFHIRDLEALFFECLKEIDLRNYSLNVDTLGVLTVGLIQPVAHDHISVHVR